MITGAIVGQTQLDFLRSIGTGDMVVSYLGVLLQFYIPIAELGKVSFGWCSHYPQPSLPLAEQFWE